MEIPNYFLADLPPEATLNAGMIIEACQTLKRNRERYLADRSTASLVHTLCEVAQNWLRPDYPLRRRALEMSPAATGFSPATLAAGLDGFLRQFTPDNFRALLDQELGHPERLDELAASPAEARSQRRAMACGPALLVHFTGGSLPNPAWMSMALGMLLRSAQFVKCASGQALLPRFWAHSLYDAEPKLGACLEVAEWRGGNTELEAALFAEAGCVTATGDDATLGAIRKRLPEQTQFVGYGHRVSFGYITQQSLAQGEARRVVRSAAQDVVAWNQLGCLSPHVFYVEQGQERGAELFAAQLAEELARHEEGNPRGAIPVEAAAAIASRRALYEVRAAHSPDTRHWFSPQSTAWTVIYEADPRFQYSCLHRFVYVKGVADLAEALQGADAVRQQISTVGLAATPDQQRAFARQLARWGAPRICPLGQMQNPPFTWRHDGQPLLAGLVRWTDWEAEL